MIREILSPYLGTLVNFIVVLIMGTIGTLIKKGLPERFAKSVMSAMAVCVIYIGIEGALEAAPPTSTEILSPGLFKTIVITLFRKV